MMGDKSHEDVTWHNLVDPSSIAEVQKLWEKEAGLEDVGAHSSSSEDARLVLSDDSRSDLEIASLSSSSSAVENSPALASSDEEACPPSQLHCVHMRPLVNRNARMQEQGQGLLVNLVLGMRKLSASLLKSISEKLQCKKRTKSVYAISGCLLGLKSHTVRHIFTNVKNNDYRVIHAARHPKEPNPWSEVTAEFLLKILVRTALSNAVEGHSGHEYERAVTRLGLCGIPVGGRFSDRRFAREVEFLAAQTLQHLDGHDINGVLPGLGIPSDFGLVIDPVSLGVGSSLFPRHGTILATCLTLVSRHNGSLYSPMLGGASLPVEGHTGNALRDLALQTLLNHPAGLGLAALQSRLSVVGGDGAIVRGGQDARHKGSEAAEKIWDSVHPNAHMSCTIWDKFHVADIGFWRAIRQVPAATAIFDVSAAIDRWFGHGDGSLLYRGVSHLLGEARGVMRNAAPGTRKVVYSAGVPLSLLKNYKRLHLAMHARILWRQSGHSSQTLTNLTTVSRVFADVGFITFALAFHSVLSQVVRPYAKIVQSACEPWAIQNAENQLLGKIAEFRNVLHSTRILMRVVTLCRQHLSTGDWLNFFRAQHASSMGRSFPSLFRSLHSLLDRIPASFQGCALGERYESDTKKPCLGPHCQCGAQFDLYQNRPPGWSIHARDRWMCWVTIPKGSRAKEQENFGQKGKLQVKVPCWVGFPQGSLGPVPSRLVEQEPRAYRKNIDIKHGMLPTSMSSEMFRPSIRGPRQAAASRADSCKHHLLLRTRECPPVYGRMHSKSHCYHFRRKITSLKDRIWTGTCTCQWKSRCQVPTEIYIISQQMDEALVSVEKVLDAMEKELTSLFGSVGMCPEMVNLYEAGAVCFDWKFLAMNRPSTAHIHAFKELAAALAPLIRHTYLPTAHEHPNLPRQYPRQDALMYQYMVLSARLRRFVNGEVVVPGLAPQSCREVHSYKVSPVVCTRFMQHTFQKIFHRIAHWRKQMARHMPQYIAHMVQVFLGTVEVPSRTCFHSLPYSVVRLPLQEMPRKKRKKNVQPEVGDARLMSSATKPLCIGDVALLRLEGGARKQMIVVCAIDVTINASAISSALDMHPYFSSGICWWVARLHHRARTLYPVESACERVGSTMHLLWSDEQHWTPGPFMDRVLLRQAHVLCLGAGRDELIVEAVVQALLESRKRRISTVSKSTRKLSSAVLGHLELLRDSGRAV